MNEVERATGRTGVAATRRLLAVPIDRVGAVYKPQCCGRPYASWHDAGQHIIRNECETEGKP